MFCFFQNHSHSRSYSTNTSESSPTFFGNKIVQSRQSHTLLSNDPAGHCTLNQEPSCGSQGSHCSNPVINKCGEFELQFFVSRILPKIFPWNKISQNSKTTAYLSGLPFQHLAVFIQFQQSGSHPISLNNAKLRFAFREWFISFQVVSPKWEVAFQGYIYPWLVYSQTFTIQINHPWSIIYHTWILWDTSNGITEVVPECSRIYHSKKNWTGC